MALAPTPQRGVLKRAGSRWRSRKGWVRWSAGIASVFSLGIPTIMQYRNDVKAIREQDAKHRFYTENGAEKVRAQLEAEKEFAAEYERAGERLQSAINELSGISLDSDDPAEQAKIDEAQEALMDFNLAYAHYQQGLTRVGTNPTDLELNPDQRIPRRAIRTPLTLEGLLQQDEAGRQVGLENFNANFANTLLEEERLDYARTQLINVINARIPVDGDRVEDVDDKRNKLATGSGNQDYRNAVAAYQSKAADHTMRVIRSANLDNTVNPVRARRAPSVTAPATGGLPMPPSPTGAAPGPVGTGAAPAAPGVPAAPAPGATGPYTPPTGRGRADRRRAHFRPFREHWRTNPVAATAQVVNALRRQHNLNAVDRRVTTAAERYRTLMDLANARAAQAHRILAGDGAGTSFHERQLELQGLQGKYDAMLNGDVYRRRDFQAYDVLQQTRDDIRITLHGDPDNKKDNGLHGTIAAAEKGLGRNAGAIETRLVLNAIRDGQISFDDISAPVEDDALRTLADLGLSVGAAQTLGATADGSPEREQLVQNADKVSDRALAKGKQLAALRQDRYRAEVEDWQAGKRQEQLDGWDPQLAELRNLRADIAEKERELSADRQTHAQLASQVDAAVGEARDELDTALTRARSARSNVMARNATAATRAGRTGVSTTATRARHVQQDDITDGRVAPTVTALPAPLAPPRPVTPPSSAAPAAPSAPTR